MPRSVNAPRAAFPGASPGFLQGGRPPALPAHAAEAALSDPRALIAIDALAIML